MFSHCLRMLRLTCGFSARTVTALLLCLVLNTGVRPAMLPRLERLLATCVGAQGTLTALEVAAACMMTVWVTIQGFQGREQRARWALGSG